MLLIKNANVKTMCGPLLEDCDILVEGGKISAIGRGLPTEPDAQIIHADGMLAVPGFIDAHCHMGLFNVGPEARKDICNEYADPILPQIRAIDGYDARSAGLKSAHKGGVTTIMTGPGSANIIGGQFAIFKTVGGSIERSLVKAPAAMKVAMGENPISVYGAGQKRAPFTRMGIAAQLREFLLAAQKYAKEAEIAEKPEYNEKYEAMLPVFRGELPLKIHAHSLNDMENACRICAEFDLRFTLDHCTQACEDPMVFAKKPEGVIVGPYIYVADKQEEVGVGYGTAAALHKLGMKVAIASDWPILPMELFPLQAGLSICDGLSEEEVWKMITVNPAEILGISERVGTLEPGKDADIVLFRGDPLREIGAFAQTTIIGGQIVYSAE